MLVGWLSCLEEIEFPFFESSGQRSTFLDCPQYSSKQTEVIHQDEHGGSSQLFAVWGGGGQHPHIHRVFDGQGGLGLDEIEIAQLITRRMQQNFKF